MALEPCETINREIIVKVFSSYNVNSINCSSVSEAIQEVKSHKDPYITSVKIILEDEVVYFSEKHGRIENWELEWERQKRILKEGESDWECPNGIVSCYENDLCLDCQLSKAVGNND